jgi:hypothetical protein
LRLLFAGLRRQRVTEQQAGEEEAEDKSRKWMFVYEVSQVGFLVLCALCFVLSACA